MSEASLLLWFAQQSRVEPHLRISSSGGGGNPSPKLTQKYRCGKCDECKAGGFDEESAALNAAIPAASIVA